MGFQRMVAIPQEEYAQLTSVQNVRQPLTQQFYNVENEYNQYETINDPYRRLMLQSENLQEMKELKDRMRNYITLSTPKPYRSRAQALFESIEPHIKFNDRGEIMDRDAKVIESSRIEDLIQHAVRDKRRNMLPIGWKEFVEILRKHNIPRSSLNRETLEELASAITPKRASLFSRIPIRIPRPGERTSRLSAAIAAKTTGVSPKRVKKRSRPPSPKRARSPSNRKTKPSKRYYGFLASY